MYCIQNTKNQYLQLSNKYNGRYMLTSNLEEATFFNNVNEALYLIKKMDNSFLGTLSLKTVRIVII